MTTDPVAARYAEAFFESVPSAQRLEVAEQLHALGEVVRQHGELRRFLENPDVEAPDKVRVLGAALAGAWVEDVRAFVHMSVSMGRAESLVGIAEAFQHLVDEEQGLARVTVRSAKPLPSALKARLVQAVERREQRRVELVEETQPELIGGVQVLVGNRLMDGSLTARLRELRHRLKRVRVY